MPLFLPRQSVLLNLTAIANGHMHSLYLTAQEADDLVLGKVASIDRESSINNTVGGVTDHTHVVTIAWDGTAFTATTIAGNHNHELDISNGPIHLMPLYLASGSDSPNPTHVHMAYLLESEINSLVTGAVASITKNSSFQANHVHVLTIAFDPIAQNFTATIAGNHVTTPHVYSTIAGSTFGDYNQGAFSDAASSTTSATFQTKVTMTTPTLPLGNYRIGFMCEIKNSSGGNSAEYRCLLGAAEIGRGYMLPNSNTGTEDYASRGGIFLASAISGVQTITLQYRAPAGGTASIRRARLEIWRVN